MDIIATHKGGQEFNEYTSVITKDEKSFNNIEDNSENKKGLDQYIHPYLYKDTKTQEKVEKDSTISISPRGDSLEKDINFISSYSNPYKKLKGRFETIQQWEGHVVELDDKKNVFHARLIDLTIGGTDEYTEFPYEDINEDDCDLIKEGAIFYFTIGKVTLNNGQVKKNSFVKFKRLPRFTQVDLNNIKYKADLLHKKFLDRRGQQ